MNNPLFSDTTIRLTALTREDLPTIARWYEDADMQRLFDARPAAPRSITDLEQWLDGQRGAHNGVLLGIRRQTDDALLGYVELDGILWAQRVGGLAIVIGERAERGKGYGHAAMQLALRYAFDELNLHRVQLTVFSYNTAAIRLYERLGFQREGVYREFLERDGQRHDMFLYGLLRREWKRTVTEHVERADGS
ncbi:MAG TPA: GNAT family protein [Roseiflexaceae bacterium]|jgi:RimJ/RimL family protein N-acetyltransferase|nr:GNAT family protein [Roseiflexaceae bacterium]